MIVAGLGPDRHAIGFSSGPAARRLLQTTRPSVVILDNHMPDMSGFDVTRAIRADASFQSFPVILYSADDDRADVTEAKRRGAQDRLVTGNAPPDVVCSTVRRYADA